MIIGDRKIFLTGAGGFIGSHIARKLVQEGSDVYALVRPQADLWRIEDIQSKLHIIEGDLENSKFIHEALQKIKPELAIHMAWYAVPGQYLKSFENLKNFESSVNLALALRDAGCKKLAAAGTCFEYDTDQKTLSESSPAKPKSLYASCKLGLHLILEQFSQLSGMDTAWVRFFYQYGPFEDERRLVSSVILSLLRNEPVNTTSGEQIRDFLHIEDVASAVCAVAKSKLTGPVNIGSGQPVSVKEIVTTLEKLAGKPGLIRLGAIPQNPDDPKYICADNRKLKDNTGWKPQYTLNQGLKQTLEWWKAHTGDKNVDGTRARKHLHAGSV